MNIRTYHTLSKYIRNASAVTAVSGVVCAAAASLLDIDLSTRRKIAGGSAALLGLSAVESAVATNLWRKTIDAMYELLSDAGENATESGEDLRDEDLKEEYVGWFDADDDCTSSTKASDSDEAKADKDKAAEIPITTDDSSPNKEDTEQDSESSDEGKTAFFMRGV